MQLVFNEEKVKEILFKNGIYPNLNGFYAILLCVKYAKEYFLENGTLCSTTKYLYPKVAEVLKTTPSRIERNLIHSLYTHWWLIV